MQTKCISWLKKSAFPALPCFGFRLRRTPQEVDCDWGGVERPVPRPHTELRCMTRENKCSRRWCKRWALEIASDPQALSSAADVRGLRPCRVGRRRQSNRSSRPLGLGPSHLVRHLDALWKAGYRFLDKYLSVIRQEMVLRYGSLPEAFGNHFRRIKRAAASGRGPPQHASPLPFLRFTELSDSVAPLVPDGPCHPRRLVA